MLLWLGRVGRLCLDVVALRPASVVVGALAQHTRFPRCLRSAGCVVASKSRRSSRGAGAFAFVALCAHRMQLFRGEGFTKNEHIAMIHADLMQRHAYEDYPLGGSMVCRTAYLILRGICLSTLNTYTARVQAAVQATRVNNEPLILSAPDHGRVGSRFPSEATRAACSYVLNLAMKLGEYNPVTGRVHVLIMLNPTRLYNEFYAPAFADSPALKLSLVAFCRMFRRDVKNPATALLGQLVWRRSVTAKVCSVCTDLSVERVELQRSGKGECSDEWAAHVALHRGHVALVMGEREAYFNLSKRAREPRYLASMTVLAADEGHPVRHPRKPIDTTDGRKLVQFVSPLIGVIDHTSGRRHVFISPSNGIPTVSSKGVERGTCCESADYFLSWFLFICASCACAVSCASTFTSRWTAAGRRARSS